MKKPCENRCTGNLISQEKVCADTLQGWIKGVNSNSLNVSTDPGTDGGTTGSNQNFARDAFGYTLNYFSGDYQAIDPNKWTNVTNRFEAGTAGSDWMSTRRNLYNGNISAMATTITNPDTRQVMPLGAVYRYDQLNRITEMKGYANFDFTNNVWKTESLDGSMYFNNYSYDANGNLLSLQRKNQSGVMFDSFKYKYLKVGDKAVSNRLYHVNDSINASIMTDDIDDEGTYSDASETINSWNNYGYDEIGNLQRDSTEGIKHIEWTAYGKIKSIVRRDGYFKTINGVNVYPSNLEFKYDAMGNRIAKIEKPRDANGQKSSADWKTTYYIRDAQGNPMATYKKSSETEAASYKLIEHPIYGSSRVGIDNYTVEFVGYTAPSNGLTSRVLGLKQYELTNHLGNVLTTISDKRIPVENNGVVDHYVADITTASDYYPFGSPMDGRTFSSEKYRFGFNGQEKDDEVAGAGNTNTAMFWEYDTRLGRRWNLDPKPQINISDYAVMGNSPIVMADPKGDIFKIGSKDEQAKKDVQSLVKKRNKDYVKFNNESGEVTLDFGDKSQKKIDKILKRDSGLKLIKDLSEAKNIEGKDFTFFYGTEGLTGIGLENSDMQKNIPNYYSNISTFSYKYKFNDQFGGYDPRSFVLNASNQQYSATSSYGFKPLDGYDGKVFIGRGSFAIFDIEVTPVLNANGLEVGKKRTEVLIYVSRSLVVKHELNEMFIRTVLGYCYPEAHGKAGGIGETGRFFPWKK